MVMELDKEVGAIDAVKHSPAARPPPSCNSCGVLWRLAIIPEGRTYANPSGLRAQGGASAPLTPARRARVVARRPCRRPPWRSIT